MLWRWHLYLPLPQKEHSWDYALGDAYHAQEKSNRIAVLVFAHTFLHNTWYRST